MKHNLHVLVNRLPGIYVSV